MTVIVSPGSTVWTVGGLYKYLQLETYEFDTKVERIDEGNREN